MTKSECADSSFGLRHLFVILVSSFGFLSGSSLCDRHLLQRIPSLNLIHHILPAGRLAKHGVLAVQPIRYHVRDEELAAVSVWPGVGHAQAAALVLAIFAGREFVIEAIPRPAAPATFGVATLHHEVGDHPV